MKYPKGSYIVRNGKRRKVLAALESLRWLSNLEGSSNWDTIACTYFTIEELEWGGWEEEKGPWKPEEEHEYWYVDTLGEPHVNLFQKEYSHTEKHVDVGNCYQTKEEAEKAAERVKKAYKGV